MLHKLTHFWKLEFQLGQFTWAVFYTKIHHVNLWRAFCSLGFWHLPFLSVWSYHFCVITRANSSHVGRFFSCICLSVHLFSTRYLKNRCNYDQWHRNIETFYHESWKPIYFGIKGQGRVSVGFSLLWVPVTSS